MNQKKLYFAATTVLITFSIASLALGEVLFSSSFDYGETGDELQNVTSDFAVDGNDGNTIYDESINLTYPGYFSVGGTGAMIEWH